MSMKFRKGEKLRAKPWQILRKLVKIIADFLLKKKRRKPWHV
jgi:hypothetical protein